MWDKGQESGRDGCIGAVAAYESLEPPATSDTLLYEGTHGWVVVVEAVDSLCPVGKLASRIGSVSPALSGLAALSPIAVTERPVGTDAGRAMAPLGRLPRGQQQHAPR